MMIHRKLGCYAWLGKGWAQGEEQRGGAVRKAMISGFKALHCLKISRILVS